MNRSTFLAKFEVKMKPVKAIQHYLIWFCMCPADDTTSKSKKRAHIGITSLCLINLTISLISSIVYAVKFVSVDLEKSLYALFQIVACQISVYYVIVGYFSRHQIHTIFTELEKLYCKCKSRNFFHHFF